jgi:hypothetical protein
MGVDEQPCSFAGL